MARRTNKVSERTEQSIDSDITPDKFPPDGLFTGRAIAQYLGIHEDTVSKRYYKRYCLEIYQNCPELLKKGQLYTQVFFDECFRIRQSCNSDRLVIGSKGQIIRHADGLPVLEPNPEKLSKNVYIKLRFEEQPELKEEVREDSPEVLDGELEESTLTVYDPESADKFIGALDKAEDLQESMQTWSIAISQAADKTADKASAQFAERFMERFNKNMGELQKNLGKALE